MCFLFVFPKYYTSSVSKNPTTLKLTFFYSHTFFTQMKVSPALASKGSVPFYLLKSLRQKKTGCNRKPMCLTVEVSEVFYKMESYKNKLHTKHRYKSCLKLYAIISFLSTLYNHYWTTHTFYSLLKKQQTGSK